MTTEVLLERGAAVPDAAGYEVEVVRSKSGFDALREEWNALAAAMDLDSPMLSWEWNRLWWDRFHGRNQLCILVFRDGGRVAGIAQLQERRVGRGPLSVRALKPIGWEDGGNQGLTEHLELLFPPASRPSLMAELGDWLARAGAATLWLPSVGLDEILPGSLERGVVRAQPEVPFHHRRLPGSWVDFVQGLGKSMRDNVKYYPRLLERKGFPFQLEVSATPAEVVSALPRLFELHQIRARAEDVSRVRHWDHFHDQQRREFMLEIAPRLAEQGQLKVGLLRIGDEIVAGQMWFEKDRTIWVYYSGFLPEWSKYSVALVTTLEVLKQGVERGFDRVEFLRGGGQIKERWDTDARVQRHLLCASNPAVGRAFIRLQAHAHRFRGILARGPR